MTTLLRHGIAWVLLAGMTWASPPAAAQEGPWLAPHDYYATPWQGWYAGVHLGYGDADFADGFVGGGQIGYNWQGQQLVYGLEVDVTGTTIESSDHFSVCATPALTSCVAARTTASIDWTVTVRGRLGFLVQPGLMAYATAGFGFVRSSASTALTAPGFDVQASEGSNTDVDFVYGLGMEGKLSAVTSLRVEYLGFSDTDIQVIRAGINFKLGY